MYVYLVWKQTELEEEVLYIYRNRDRAETCAELCIKNNKDEDTYFFVQEREVML